MDLVSIIALSILLAWGVLAVVISLVRGLAKARIRGICLLISAALAIVGTLILKNWITEADFAKEYLIPWVERFEQPILVELLGLSEGIQEVVVKSVVAVAAPLACFLLFLVFSFLSWIVYLLITLPFKDEKKKEKKPVLAPVRALIWGVVGWVLGFVFLMLPISTYVELLEPVDDTLKESEMMQENKEVADVYEVVSDTFDSLGGMAKFYNTLGGDRFCALIGDFKIEEERVHLADEIHAMTGFALDVVDLSKKKIDDYGEREEAIFKSMADRFGESEVISSVVCDVVENASESWLEGDKFLGQKKPDFGESKDIFDPFFTDLLTVLNQDSNNPEALEADFRTIAELITVFSENGLFKSMNNHDRFMDKLTTEGLTAQIIEKLEANSTMCVLVDEITDMGLRVVASKVSAPDVDPEEYEPMMEDVAGALNGAKDLPEEERREYLNTEVDKALADAGIEGVDETLVNLYTERLEEELMVKDNITADDVREFFDRYYPGNTDAGSDPVAE